jgi:hypothetical protein
MEWINIHSATLNSPEFLGSEPIDRATWLMLLHFCCTQENGGRIQGCQDWGDRRWQQICRVTHREVGRSCELWNWDGKDLVVSFYPEKKEREVQAKRLAGIGTASRRWNREADSSATSSPELLTQKEQDAEGKGREGKGKEGEGNRELPPPAAIPATPRGPAPSVVPTVDDVLAWARSWPGLPAVGIPSGIPEPWVLDWFAYRTRPGQAPLGDWQREVALRFRSDWQSRHPKAIGTVREQKGATRSGGAPEGATARRIRLEGVVKEAVKALADAEEAVTRASGLKADGNPAGEGLLKSAEARYAQAEERLTTARAELAGEVVA